MTKPSPSLTLLGGVLAHGRTFPVYLRRHKKMKRISVCLSTRSDSVMVSAGPRVPLIFVHDFLKKAQTWIEQAVEKRPVRSPFIPGLQIPVLGKMMTLEHCESPKSHVSYTETKLIAAGAISEFNIMIKKLLKQLALQEIQKQSFAYADLLSVFIHKISIKDTVSCWGSCSGKGNLSFNWRIVLAPPAVLSYLCAHEVSHLKHKNHSVNFWKTVESLCPDYKDCRTWLKKNGSWLFVYGFPGASHT
jgi:predicted metal-dependent hydrolase